MPGQEFKIKSENPWDTLLLPEGAELKVGNRIYNGSRTMRLRNRYMVEIIYWKAGK